MERFDFKKELKPLSKLQPVLSELQPAQYLMVDGAGDPNTENGAYQHALSLLYALSFTIKMSKLKMPPPGYFDYVVGPLEGLWWMQGGKAPDFAMDKSKFLWTSMIRQPSFVTPAVFRWAQDEVKKKKPEFCPEQARLVRLEEGLCVQCMHKGPYDSEPETLEKIHKFLQENKLANDISELRRHHEIYLGDPRKSKPENLKTVLRIPVRRV